MLSAAELDRIEAAVRDAESRTAGEIVVVLSRQAASYRSATLAAALVAALLVPWPLVWLTELGTSRILVVQLTAALAVAALTQARAVRRAMVPSAVRRRRGREAAERAFASCGLAATPGRTGILIYVALAERHAEVIGDTAIAALIPDTAWRGIIEGLVDTTRRDGLADGIVSAIGDVGRLLAAHVPVEPRPSDALPNRVVLL